MMKNLLIACGQTQHPAFESMEKLAAAVAKDRLQSGGASVEAAWQALQDAAGEHVVLDTAGVIGMFSAMTIVVDLSGHTMPAAIPTILAPVFKRLAACRRCRYCSRRCRTHSASQRKDE